MAIIGGDVVSIVVACEADIFFEDVAFAIGRRALLALDGDGILTNKAVEFRRFARGGRNCAVLDKISKSAHSLAQ
jgi:hypothetical protein